MLLIRSASVRRYNGIAPSLDLCGISEVVVRLDEDKRFGRYAAIAAIYLAKAFGALAG